MKTTCRECIDAMMDYVDGVLSPADHADFEEHLADCPPCVDFLASYRATPRIVRDATEVEMPAELEERLRRFVERTRRQSD